MLCDNCWRCGGTAAPETITLGGSQKTRVRCRQCGAVGLSFEDPRMAVTVWDDTQRELRRHLTDTELLDGPAGAGDKLREDAP